MSTSDSGFPVTPTPDNGVLHSDQRPWDETTRPSGPTPEPGRDYGHFETEEAQRLVDIHDHLRGELGQIFAMVDQVEAGALDAAGARSELNRLTVRQNNWTVGAYCASYCRLVATHHTIEDRAVFPRLRSGDPRLAPVIDRLEEEHLVIAEVLETVDRALVALVSESERLAELRAAVDLLSDTLLSHLSYEERELVEPIARLGMH